MLILVAVTVRTVVQSGLFGHASKATSGYSMHQAREQLGTTLAGAQTEKYTNKDYNEFDYLDKYIKDNLPNSKVDGNIAIVDGWAFELDRSVPKIGQDLGKEGTFTYPDLKLEKGTLADDKLSIPITITTKESEHGISKIEVILNGSVIETFDDCNNSTEEIVKTFTATENGTYYIKVYSEINRTGYININEIVAPTPKIGDYVAYTPDTADNYLIEAKYNGHLYQSIPQDTTLKWQILNYNEDDIEIISEMQTTTTVNLSGTSGYNNGVFLLNDLCNKHYSNKSLGAVGRSINITDIEKRMNSLGIEARNAYTTINGVKYGEYKDSPSTYTPDIFKHVEQTAEGENSNYYSTPTTETWTQESSLNAKQTFYEINQTKNYYDDEEVYDLIFLPGNEYWLASRFTDFSYGYAQFGLKTVGGTQLSSHSNICASGGGINPVQKYVRPIVEFPSTYELTRTPGSDEWQITRK